MNQVMDIQRLLDLRKITQAFSRKFEAELKAHLSTLAPLFSPLQLFGDYVRGGARSSGPQAEKAYRELLARFHAVAGEQPYCLKVTLASQLDLFAATPVLTPIAYTHTAYEGETAHPITVTRPLKWALSYPDADPARLKALAASERSQVENELSHALLQSLALSVLLEQRPGLGRLFESLRCPLRTERLDGLGALPVLSLSCPLESRLPDDGIIIQNTQLSGIPSFEEIIDVEDILRMPDPVRQELLAITQSQSPAIYGEITGY